MRQAGRSRIVIPMWEFLSSLRYRLPFRRIHDGAPLVAVVRLTGPIGMGGATRGGLNLANIAQDLEAAFKLRGVKAVALAVNSPGGSPVQSNLIFGRIRALAKEHEVPVFAFAEDVAASGGYWLLCAGDEIYVDANSIIGSIGVISAGFGFVEMLSKIGVERRLYAEGDHKGMLDSFSPEKSDDVKRLKAIQKSMHTGFMALVRDRRGKKLKGTDKKLFSGEFWTGESALAMGLVDGIGDLRTVMRDRYGEKVRLKVVGRRSSRFRRMFSAGMESGGDFGADWPDRLLAAAEARAMWSRFGL